ncbi:GtrA family protein [Corynebacterium aquilae]|uniref:Membrane protein n=1 Tax=Corynebacterium aquilae DSM 44791 TaxID=1431546 RepID=A0A1L7CF72_9CORY|nr:GtrA family protein [Corynebacterium aquilae]APT84477.1 membrane protein [Corynebacterium aquilae DSM 44791]
MTTENSQVAPAPTPHHRRAGLLQFLKFGIVGGSGVLVNMAVTIIVTKIILWTAGIVPKDAFFNLLGSQFHVRWYHVIVTIAFLVANTWNYQLNRMWTFKADNRRSWWREFFPFLTTGIGSFLLSQIVITLLMNPTSPLHLPADIFDDSSGVRNMFYWATLISIVVAMPVNFIVNRLWTFRGSKVAPAVIVVDQPPR